MVNFDRWADNQLMRESSEAGGAGFNKTHIRERQNIPFGTWIQTMPHEFDLRYDFNER